MKSISAEAMAAIEAGEAIVTGAVEIYTPGRGPIGVPEATDGVLTWQQLGDDAGVPDDGGMRIEYFDENNDNIGTDTSSIINAAYGVWTLRTLNSSTPAGAIRMRVSMIFAKDTGSATNQGIDDISMSLGGAPVPLINPGAEFGDNTGWTVTQGTAFRIFDAFNDVPPYEGDHYFYGPGSGGQAHIQSQDVYLSEIIPVEPGVVEAALRVWGGYGPIELDGEVYEGVGDRGLAQRTGGAVGGIAQGIELVLSRVEPELLVLLDADEIRGGAVILRRLIFASDGKTLLDYDIWDRGRVDTVSTVETVGGQATIKVGVESAARGLGRSGHRMRADSDQRLINPNDGYFRKTSYAGEKMLYWGGKKPGRTGGSTYIGNPASGGSSG